MARQKRPLLWFERKHQPLISGEAYARRLARNAAAALLLIFLSLAAGMLGYHWTESMSWIDAYINAAMILSGMGPLDPPKTWGGKFFAGTYALYSGLALLIASGVILAPVLHRMMHHFHLQSDEDQAAPDQASERPETDVAGHRPIRG